MTRVLVLAALLTACGGPTDMSWTIGVRTADVAELHVGFGASNMGAHSATNPSASWRSGPAFATADLGAALADVPFATYKDIGGVAGNPVSHGWDDLAPFGDQGGSLIHGPELSLGRYLHDRKRPTRIITHARGGSGARVFTSGAQRTALRATIDDNIATIGGAFVVPAIFCFLFTGSTGSEEEAAAIGTDLTTVFADITNRIGTPAANAAWLMVEPNEWVVTNAGEWGPTAYAALQTWMATPVENHQKIWVPTRAWPASTSPTGHAESDIGFSTLHPGNPIITELGRRWGQVLAHSVLPMYRR